MLQSNSQFYTSFGATYYVNQYQAGVLNKMNGATNPWTAQESCLQFVPVAIARAAAQRLLVTTVTINKASVMST